jgi:hypothetical protein
MNEGGGGGDLFHNVQGRTNCQNSVGEYGGEGFHDFAEIKTNISVHIAGWSCLNDLANNKIHVSGFSAEDGGAVKLNALPQMDSMFSYG